MVGMPREQVLSCMGAPANAAKAGNTEVWSYNSGNGETDTFGSAFGTRGWGWASAFGSSTSTSKYCKVDIVMNNGRVSRVNYSGPTGGLLTEGEQCAYAVDNCAQEAATMPASAQAGIPPAVPQPDASAQPKAGIASSKDDEAIKKWARENGYQYGNSSSRDQ
ncbi:MAG TPA: hypothetical protein VG891_04775 [Rhizomicrobium sp.]|nr:hypothetical protein [Rhizomicrobium sp.]